MRPEDFDHPVFDGESQRFTKDDGSEEWTRDGKLHRVDGPAVIWPDGTRKWFFDGKLHREDGPAVEWGGERSDREDAWFVNGEPQDATKMKQKRLEKEAAAEAFAKAVAIAEANTSFGTTRTVMRPKTATFKKTQSP